MDIRIAIASDQLKTSHGAIGQIRFEAITLRSTHLSHDTVVLRLIVLLLRHHSTLKLVIATDMISGEIELEHIRERVASADLELVARLRIEVSTTTATRDQLTILIVEALTVRIQRSRLVGDIEATQRRIEGERLRGLVDETEADS